MTKELISIVIPCYCEENVLPLLFERLTKACESWHRPWEVICVDDGSGDRTLALLKSFHRQDTRWKVISLSRNFGHQTAVSAGLFHASGAAVIMLDADLQDPPEELHRFIAKWAEGYDVVYGIRQHRPEGTLKKVCYWAFYRLLAKAVSFDIPLDTGDFCIMSRRVLDALNQMPERNRYVRGLRAWAGFKQIGIPYERHGRAAGEPKYTYNNLIKLALDGLVSFSAFPLKISSYIGFVISFFSLLGVLFTLLQRLFRSSFESIGLGLMPGFATIVISILFLGGIQLICLGVLGEYLFRIFEEVKRRPNWIIKESAGIDPLMPQP